MDGRSLPVEFSGAGIRTHQTLFVPRLKFVCVSSQRFKIGYPIVTGAGSEDVVEHQRAKGCVSTRTAPADCHSLTIGLAAFFEISGGIDAILNIDDAPLTF